MGGKAGILDRWAWRLGALSPASRLRVHPRIFTGILGYHALALLACLPWLFTWSGLAWALAGVYLFGTLGINIGFHRLLTHRGFTCPRWLERTLAVLGACCWQGTPLNWVAIHRMHHHRSDGAEDPHSPHAGFFWAHMGWFLIYDPAIWDLSTYERYGRDLLRDRFYKAFERRRVWRAVHLIQWAAFSAAGLAAGALTTGAWPGAVRVALSWLVWGVFVRTVLVWHITWSVNSVTHLWGYRNFETGDNSRNNWLVALLSNGEGWHNNHHAQPRSAAQGMRWWELDVSYLTIRALEWVGLARDVVRPRRGVGGPAEGDPEQAVA
jgi:stearoyl-CoA desaturase (delta-9 desaturase)